MSAHSNVYEAIAVQVAMAPGLDQAQEDVLLSLANEAEEEVFGWVELWESSAEEAEVLALWAALVRERYGAAADVAPLAPLLAWAAQEEAQEEAQAAQEWTAQDVAAAAPAAAQAVAGGVGKLVGALVLAGAAALALR